MGMAVVDEAEGLAPRPKRMKEPSLALLLFSLWMSLGKRVWLIVAALLLELT